MQFLNFLIILLYPCHLDRCFNSCCSHFPRKWTMVDILLVDLLHLFPATVHLNLFLQKHPSFPLRQCPSPSLSVVIWVGLASFAFLAVGFSPSALLFLWIRWLVHHPIWTNETPRDNCRGFWEISIPCLLLESQRRPHPSGCCSEDVVFITARARRWGSEVRWNPDTLSQTMPASKSAFRLAGCISQSTHFLL